MSYLASPHSQARSLPLMMVAVVVWGGAQENKRKDDDLTRDTGRELVGEQVPD